MSGIRVSRTLPLTEMSGKPGPELKTDQVNGAARILASVDKWGECITSITVPRISELLQLR